LSTAPLDPRRNAYRPDLAADALRGRIKAPRYASGESRQVVHAATPLRAQPNALASWTTEALFGELATVYDEREGWAWVQLARDGYVGYLRSAALSAQVKRPTHWVKALGTFFYPSADLKACPWMQLSMNALVAVAEPGPIFSRLADGSFVPTRHIAELERFAPDFVAVAERFTGVPYLWGGRTRLGIDCSGLLQLAMHAAGLTCPRDSDMQRAELGGEVVIGSDLDGLTRGDLVFWNGHVGVMLDAFLVLHANAHHMAVVAEPINNAVDRIMRGGGGAITAVKRLAGKSAAPRSLASSEPSA
jgi:cell wall-associated NlpC family hydrolase